MKEFSGKAGTIYIQKSDHVDDEKYEVWFEDFCILGTGNTPREALEDAGRHTIDILEVVLQAKAEIVAHEASASAGD